MAFDISSWGGQSSPKDSISKIIENFRALKDDGIVKAAECTGNAATATKFADGKSSADFLSSNREAIINTVYDGTQPATLTFKGSTPENPNEFISTRITSSKLRNLLITSPDKDPNGQIYPVSLKVSGDIYTNFGLNSKKVATLEDMYTSIANSVKLGVGISSPAWRLDVADGFVNSTSGYKTNGADFGEMFESVDGKTIPTGTSVVMENEKIRAAKEGETPIGVISATCSWVGNNGGKEWPKKYLRNDLGELIYEDNLDYQLATYSHNGKIAGVRLVNNPQPKVNPDYDPNKEYILREKRPEWHTVGLLGQVRILKGQPTAPSWVKLKDISEGVELWLIK